VELPTNDDWAFAEAHAYIKVDVEQRLSPLGIILHISVLFMIFKTGNLNKCLASNHST
jgi:hypothetical protein